VALGLLAFVGTVAVTSSSAPSSLAFAAMSGVALLSLTLIGIMVLTRAVGMTDGTQALGLPQGSIRALLAFALAIVFVSVASWTLGGLFDPMGPQVAKDAGSPDDVAKFLTPYQSDRYIIVESQPDGKTASASVYLKREAPEKDVVDIAKQIVTISATVLVTIVGFYFGAQSTSDVAKSVNDSLAVVRRSITDTQNTLSGTGQNAGAGATQSPSPAGTAQNTPAAAAQTATGGAAATAPATADGIAKTASAVGALATATAAKLQSLGPAPMDVLRQAVAEGKGGDAAKAALASAETSFSTLSAQAKACEDAGSQAAQLAQSANGADQATLNLANGKLQGLHDSATQANHEFEQAFAPFIDSRQKILAATAK
jgi:hypothetical protein